ncbi:LrgB family protein [Agrobacterium sp. LAD9]|uniref:LrgB family protein n=1 Tax=Agrobacterium sp. LAD9 TaxID=2055153 RepID=UPI000D1EA615|nr:LrgB family protein [Agrobacterium sp. LAD9]
MREPAELWIYLSTSPLLWLCLTIYVWIVADKVSAMLRRHPLANPVLIAIAVLSALLSGTGAEYRRFFEGAQFIHFLLGPATVALAIPLYRQWQHVRRLFVPLVAALAVGSITAVMSVVFLGHLFELPRDVLISFLPKSATAGVAMSVSESLGGNPSLTAVLVILTGIFGAVLVTPLMNLLGIRDYAARGFAVGLTSHGIGTARAFNVDPMAGLFAGIAMALNAIATATIVPIVAKLSLS